ncbi:MAG: FHA domain-containing protein [Chloroflexi bacterium]|nr:FHA domain-containing protein [Chloroflexota bacterium]MCI0581201.1 FHA domain-containing protein [Chloroflexota bacterium]MCI0644125.1 FHA domain-containing protein [Chloroflexota bacterium]MCI0731746.1 FHA domain-containing protein [Chloroflexota bacterium]
MSTPAQARLIVEEGPNPGQEFILIEFPVVVGRASSADVAIADQRISREHARLSYVNGHYQIEDLGSSNGTFVNDVRLDTRQPLQDGDRISLGLVLRFRFKIDAKAQLVEADPPPTIVFDLKGLETIAGAPVVPGYEPGQPRPPQLTVIMPDGTEFTHELTAAEITIGRAPDSDITIKLPFVSRNHMQLKREGHGYKLHVLAGAANPVVLQQQPVTSPTSLRDGQEMTIGKVGSDQVVRIRYTEPELATPPDTETMIAASPHPALATMVSGDQTSLYSQVTVIGETPQATTPPPQLVVTIAGREPQIYTLQSAELTVGRAPQNDIVIADNLVSREQARLRRVGAGYELLPLTTATNALYMDGKVIKEPTLLKHGAILRIGGGRPGEIVSMVYLSPVEGPGAQAEQTILFEDNNLITIGRDKSNDIVLDAPTISRFHAQVERVGRRYRVRDLRSANGTFVDDRPVVGEAWLQQDTTLRIGPYRFVMGQDELIGYDDSQGMRVEAVGLKKWVRKELNVLQDISLVLERREFVVVVGQSGGGKSSLVDAIAGYRPATHGKVHVNGIDVYKNFDAIRDSIGYVPQRDIIHMELTTYQALDYAARLRMPPDTTEEERRQRVLEVLEELDLAERQDVQISGLSGGQQKRVSIGVELLTKPGLFFLDEATSGLDPGTETALMQLLRLLADQGRTIVLITHATKNVMLADKVVFLARGGHLAWFGPPEEALTYFESYRSERDRRTREIEFDEIYNLLDNPEHGSPADWAERYRQHAAYEKYVAQPLKSNVLKKAAATPAAVPETKPRQRRRKVSALRQLLILSARNLRILTRDRASLVLMLLTAPIIAVLDFVLASGIGRNPFSFADGDMNGVVISAIAIINSVIMVGGLSQMRELVKERDIYRRERMVMLRLIPYILSKVWLAAILAVYQAFFFTLMRYLAFDMPGGVEEAIFISVTIFLLTMAGSMLGLFASAVAPNNNTAPLILILLIIPQMVLSGGLVPLPSVATTPASSRWAFQGLMVITGGGSDVDADVCWELPTEQQELLTAAQKEESCNCMGVNALRQESCDFPGLGQHYEPAIDEPDPEEPPPLGDEPAPPELPAEPIPPADQTDAIAMNQYFEQLAAFNREVAEAQAVYEADVAAYRVEQELHEVQQTAYQAEKAELEIARAAATSSAEAQIRIFYEDFSWTFVNKENRADYYGTVLTVWVAQIVIIFLLLAGTVFVQKRRDVT